MLDLTLPFVGDVELETLIDQRTATLCRQLDSDGGGGGRNTGGGGGGVRGLMAVQFFEKKRRKTWFAKGDEEVCWEQWTLDVTLATPRTESGMFTLVPQKASLVLPEGKGSRRRRDADRSYIAQNAPKSTKPWKPCSSKPP